jgi:hypothetical protein
MTASDVTDRDDVKRAAFVARRQHRFARALTDSAQAYRAVTAVERTNDSHTALQQEAFRAISIKKRACVARKYDFLQIEAEFTMRKRWQTSLVHG